VVGIMVAAIAAVIYYFQYQAMIQQVELSKDTWISAQRAYVSVNGLNIEPITDAKKQITFWKIAPKIANSGNTSTREMWFTAVANDFHPISDSSSLPPQPTPQDLSAAARNRAALGAHQETDLLLPQPVSAEIMEAVRNRKMAVYLHGAVIYGDFFTPATHITRYCYTLWANPAITGVSGFAYSMCGGRTNCQDEECDTETQKQLREIAARPN